MFIANYGIADRTGTRKIFKFKGTTPTNLKGRAFPESIVGVSPAFCEIHRQAEAASVLNLDQLEGIGLRKALEFLVKDYAGHEHPGDEAKIRSMPLANCIETYISDVNVKQCSKRAAWLGNDETHYSRKWETKDIEDLRRLVHLTVNGIDNALLAKKYMSEMP